MPTHHGRCDLLKEALESVAPQITPNLASEVEIVVSDNASQDGTAEMVDNFRSRHPQITVIYGRNDRNIGLQNLTRAVERSSGEWCWLFGSDDVMAQGALSVVVEAVHRFPNVTGISFAKSNFRYDMSERLEFDQPEFFPVATVTTEYDDYASVIRELAFQHAVVGASVARRDRWLAAAAKFGKQAVERHPDWPHLVIIADMARTDPSWVWLPVVLVKARAGRPYLVEVDAGEPNLSRVHIVLVDGLRRAWKEVANGDKQLRRALMGKSYAVVGSADVVSNIKSSPSQTLRRDLGLFVSFTRAFWMLPTFRRRCLARLVVPAAISRWRKASASSRKTMTRLAPDEMVTTLEVLSGTEPRARASMQIRCALTNRGGRALVWAYPNPVALGFRWVDTVSGDVVLASDRVLLPDAIEPGQRVVLEARVLAPWDPGEYELRVSPVQEFIAWFDDINPGNGFRMNMTIEPADPFLS